jgi:hypothetical protein
MLFVSLLKNQAATEPARTVIAVMLFLPTQLASATSVSPPSVVMST